jgi:hypothetical protein
VINRGKRKSSLVFTPFFTSMSETLEITMFYSACSTHNPKVAGSNPAPATNKSDLIFISI